jgi:PTS system cellobiose-specific IIC component
MGEFFQNNVLPAIMAFVNTKAVRAIKDGMVYSMPLIIVGAVYLLLFQLPVESLANFVNSTGAVPFLAHGYTSTFQITAFISAIGIAYQWAKNDGFEPLSAGIISAAAFLILIPDVIAGAGVDGADVAGLDKTWLAGQGMIGAIIAGLLCGFVYCWFLKKDIRIRCPTVCPMVLPPHSPASSPPPSSSPQQ